VKLSPKSRGALLIAGELGALFPSTKAAAESVAHVNPSVCEAMRRRGLVRRSVAGDGSTAYKITAAGRLGYLRLVEALS